MAGFSGEYSHESAALVCHLRIGDFSACNCRGGFGMLTHLANADVEARETLRVLRYTPEADDERLVRYWFCSPDCRAEFVEAVEDGEREEALYVD
jgi:hypothetical protein